MLKQLLIFCAEWRVASVNADIDQAKAEIEFLESKLGALNQRKAKAELALTNAQYPIKALP